MATTFRGDTGSSGEGSTGDTGATGDTETMVPGRLKTGRGKAFFVSGTVLLVAGGVALGIYAYRPTIKISTSASSLATAHLGGLGTKMTRATATFNGRIVPLRLNGSSLVPTVRLPPGQKMALSVEGRTGGLLSWFWGSTLRANREITTPDLHPVSGVLLTSAGHHIHVVFNSPIHSLSWSIAGVTHRTYLSRASKSITLGGPPPTGVSGNVALQAFGPSWETPLPALTLPYFVGTGSMMSVTPSSGTISSLTAPLTFVASKPISQLFGTKFPALKIALANSVPAGSWSRPNPYTLQFTPSTGALWPNQTLDVTLPAKVTLVGPNTQISGSPNQPSQGTANANSNTTLSLQTQSGSILRLQQILSTLGYLPFNWKPASGTLTTTTSSEQALAYAAPAGSFSWKWAPPARLAALWQPGQNSTMTQGAIMSFEHVMGLNPVGTANPLLWPTLAQAISAHTVNLNGYSWVDVKMALPQTATLWHNGSNIATTDANTGIPVTPTSVGTFPIYLRYPFQIMRGVNPNGSHYADPVHWVNYFNGSQAVHGFVRSNYGFPQSLGCVELPVSAAHTMYKYLHIGSLVTVHP